MRKETIKKIQEKLMKISVNSVGRSMPAGVFERKVPKEVLKLAKEEK